jgi:MFS family permease
MSEPETRNGAQRAPTNQESNRFRANVFSRELLLSLYLPSFLLSLGQGLAVPVLPVYARSFGVSFEVATLVIILHGIGGLAATFPTGYMLDRVGRRPVLFAGPILTATATILTALAQSFPELLVYRFIAGAGQQMWQQSRVAMIADTGRANERGRQMKWMQGLTQISHLGSPAIGGLIAAVWDVRAPFVIHGILTLIAIAPSFKLVKETDPGRRAGGRPSTQEGTWTYVFAQMRQPQLLAFLCAQVFANVARAFQRGGLLNLYAAYAYNVGPGTLGILASANSVIGIPITFAGGYIMDRWGRKKTIVPGFSLLFVALAGLAATAFLHLPFEAFVVAYVAVQSSQTITAGNMQVLGSDLAPRYARGRFMAAWRLGAEGAREVSIPLFALIGATLGYGAAFGSLSVASLVTALIVGLLVRETVGRLQAEDDEPLEAASGAANARVGGEPAGTHAGARH